MDLFVYLNGIDGDNGGYLSAQGIPIDQFARLAQAQAWDAGHVQDLQARVFDAEGGEYALLPEYGDGSDLALAGWGLVFAAEAPSNWVDAALEALAPLIELRRAQTGGRVRIFRGDDGVHSGGAAPERKADWLARHGAGMGPVDPEAVPYHLLIVADPAVISFQFQYELDIQYSVGRIYFDTLDEFNAYARGVARAETSAARPRRAVFFGAANPGDGSTALSAAALVAPLAAYAGERGAKLGAGWQVEHIAPELATRERLAALLGGDPADAGAPALVFSATHGLGWKQPDPRQLALQGALICQDWPGPAAGPVRREHYLAAEDIPTAANPAGMIVFLFACYSAGTPVWDDYAIAFNRQRAAIAARPFLAALPQRLLGHPHGGALALVGHVERAWGFSFSGLDERAQTQSYRSLTYQLLAGKPLGVAMDALNLRYAEMAAALANAQQELSIDPLAVNPTQLAYLWTAANDARGYIVLGDPAIRL